MNNILEYHKHISVVMYFYLILRTENRRISEKITTYRPKEEIGLPQLRHWDQHALRDDRTGHDEDEEK
jgi:hypothetical protein